MKLKTGTIGMGTGMKMYGKYGYYGDTWHVCLSEEKYREREREMYLRENETEGLITVL